MQDSEKIRVLGQRVGGQGQLGRCADGQFGLRRSIWEEGENVAVD